MKTRKMKRTKIVVAGALALLLAFSAIALPSQELYIRYYDAEGNLIGERDILCTGQIIQSGQTSDNYSVQVVAECTGYVQPIACSDQGLTTLPGGSPDFCVTEGYRLWWCTNHPGQCT